MRFPVFTMALVAGFAPLAAMAAPAGSFSNGSFESYTTNGNVTKPAASANFQFSAGTAGSGAGAGWGGDITGWNTVNSSTTGSSGAFMLLFHYSNATNSSAYAVNQYGDPGNYLPSTFPGVSPDGSSTFVALDGDTSVNGYMYQKITGLTVGQSYDLSFYWAATQLQNRVGNGSVALTDKLAVGFTTAAPTAATNSSGLPQGLSTSNGNSYYVTNTLSYTNNGSFNGSGNTAVNGGWLKVTTTFVASAATQHLSFISLGTPQGLPPVALLDGVTFNTASAQQAVPEPATLSLVLGGFGLAAFVRRRRAA